MSQLNQALPHGGQDPGSVDIAVASSYLSGLGSTDSLTLSRLENAMAEILHVIKSARHEGRFTESIRHATELLQPRPAPGHPLETAAFTAARPVLKLRGGLAGGQIRKIRLYIDSNLERSIPIGELACLAKLSVCHFSRSFLKSLGESPHAYIMRLRVERAKCLMLSTPYTLSQIAAECGLADQSHLTRLFLRFVGQPPRAWRQLQAA